MRPPQRRFRSFIVLTIALVLAATTTAHAQVDDAVATKTAPEATVDYFRDVRPILSQHCYGCHGPDDATRKAGLRLDRKQDAFADLGGAHAIAAGKPDDSLVIERIETDDVDDLMPPPDQNDPLSPKEIATLRRWVAQGASWAEHWAFIAPVKADVPAEGKNWATNAIDNFVAAHHAKAGLAPSKPADKEALIRRVTFDLTGMPPMPEEIDAFIADDKPGAYERLVDRLLGSSRYGERQAQDWLDVARYADTNGYQSDTGREAWKWREWVIKALNADMPFDQFTIEQLAGDMLPNATTEQKIATGFNRNHPTNSEGGEEVDEYRSRYVIDRVDTTATTWLGLTVACAQCHDHKYDPIPQKDFYRFYAFFNQVSERDGRGFSNGRNANPSIRVPNPDQAPHVTALKKRLDDLKQRLEAEDSISDAAQVKWEEETTHFVGDDIEWQTAEPIGMLANNGSILRRLDDGSILATGEAPVRDSYELAFKPGKRKIAAIRLEVLPHETQPDGSSGRSRKGQFILSGLKFRLSSLSDSTQPPLVFVAKADTDLNQKRPEKPEPDSIYPGGIANAIVVDDKGADGGSRSRFGRGWSIIGDERLRRHEAVVVPLETLELNSSSVLRVTLDQKSRPFKTLIGRFRISFTEDDRVRELMLPALGKVWSAVGPFPAKDSATAYRTAFDPEKKPADGVDLAREFEQPVVEKKSEKGNGKGKGPGSPSSSKGKNSSKGMSPTAKSDGSKKSSAAKPTSAKPSAMAKSGKKSTASPGAGSKKSTKTLGAKSKKKFDFKKGVVGAVADKIVEGFKPKKGSTDDKKSGKKDGKKDDKRAKSTVARKDGAKPGASDDKPSATASAKSKSSRPKKKPTMLSWKKHREWRDKRRIQLADGNVAWYLTRKITSTHPRTVTMRFDGPAGVKAWLNGEVIFQAAPKPTASNSSSRRSRFRSSGSSDDRKVRVGLREGESELLVKLVFAGKPSSRGRSRGGSSNAGGASNFNPEMFAGMSEEEATAFFQNRRNRSGGGTFTFDLTPEGDDVVNHEVVSAIRELRAADVAQVNAAEPVSLRDDAETSSPLASEVESETEEADKAKAARLSMLRKKVRTYYRENIDTVGKIFKAEHDKVKGELRSLERKLPEAMVMDELDEKKRRDTHVFIRGDYRKKGEKVEAGTPSVLPPLPKDLPRNRLGLAKWIASDDNPLTARVTVNRIWQQYFGRGLVATPDDFGIRGSVPTHPKLLDWLAREFVESGWSLKKLHKMIVMSSAYRQSSEIVGDVLEKDADNLLLARGPRRRLSAEMIRDNALTVSGLLVEKLGGKSVRPYQPKGLWSAVSNRQRYRPDKGEDQYRRGLYVYWKRGVPYPSMITFDAAKREACTVSRAETTTPLQALVLLNDPVYVEAAKMLGQRLVKDGGRDDKTRLAWGFRLCTSRQASDAEIDVLSKLLESQREHYKSDVEAAKKLIAVGEAKIGDDVGPAEAAAWTAVGSALLNLDATIHR